MPANVPAEWLRDARGDLALASIAKTPAIRYAHLCFHAQQAAEKSLKAIFSALDQDIPRTHDLAFLMDNLPATTVVPLAISTLPTLTKFAVQYRYPGQGIPVTRRDWQKAVSLARETLCWAENTLPRLRRTKLHP